MLVLDQDTIGQGWQQISISKATPKPLIHTLDQWYHPNYGWRTGSFFTSEGEPYTGRVPYRRPMTLGTKLRAIFPGWFVKVWRRKVAVLWEKTY